MSKRISSGWILLGIVAVVLATALLAPSESNDGGSYSTYSAAAGGARLGFDLAQRLGWPVSRRETEFSADTGAKIQALIQAPVGGAEAHALLDHVRKGGGLLIAGDAGVLSDSLPVTPGQSGLFAPDVAGECPPHDPFEGLLQQPRPIAPVRWKRSAPGDTIGFGALVERDRTERPAVGFALGSGRVVIVADADYLGNDVVRTCSSQTDLAYVRMLEYLGRGKPVSIAFDEYHHGRGMHGGSLSAVRQYVMTTASGRLLGQLAVAGLLLLIAVAPRPLAPRDAQRIARRNPLEHADALAHAYAAVGASRTAVTRLFGGVRRRARRGRTGRESDEQLLANAAAMSAESAAAVAQVSAALAAPVPTSELPKTAAALLTIESALLNRSPNRKS